MVENHENIRVLVMNRPAKRNALSITLLAALGDAVEEAAADRDIRVVVVTSTGTKAFCAGFDLTQQPGDDENDPQKSEGPALLERTFARLRALRKPLIASVNGTAMGAGLDLLTNCDFRVAASTATFCMPPARLGVLYSWEGHQRLARLVGIANAKELFMSSCVVNTDRATAMGLLNRVAPPERLREATMALAADLAAGAPLSVMASKEILDVLGEHRGNSFDPEAWQRIRDAEDRVWQSRDVIEGIRAFREKRPAIFKGE